MTLGQTFKEPHPFARDENLPVVEAAVNFYRRTHLQYIAHIADVEALESAGRLGAIQALYTYDPTRGISLFSYLVHAVRFSGQRQKRATDHLPRSLRVQMNAVCEEDRPAEFLAPIPFSHVNVIPNSREEDWTTFEETIPDERPPVEDQVVDTLFGKWLLDFISRYFPARYVEMIRLRFWEDLTQQETGTRLGTTQREISEMERRLFKRIRWILVSDQWMTDDGCWKGDA